jgi:hypothetical protein
MLPEICRINTFLATHPLTKHRRLPAMARVLRWQIASRIHDEVIVHWIGGTRLAARRGMTGLTGNIYAGLHEFADMAFLLHFLRPAMSSPMSEPTSAATRSWRSAWSAAVPSPSNPTR